MSNEEETKRYETYSSRAHNAGSRGGDMKQGAGKARGRLYQHHKLQLATADYHGGDYEPEFYSEQRRFGQYEDSSYHRGCDYNGQSYYGPNYGYEGNNAYYYGSSQSVRNQHSRFPTTMQSGNTRKKR